MAFRFFYTTFDGDHFLKKNDILGCNFFFCPAFVARIGFLASDTASLWAIGHHRNCQNTGFQYFIIFCCFINMPLSEKNSPFFFQCIAERIKETGAFCPQCTQPVYSLQSYSGSWTASVDTCQSVSVIWMSHIWHATMQSIIVCSVYLHSTVWIFNSRYFLDFLTIYSWFISCLRLLKGFYALLL